jgi:hypothetical protein
MLGYSADETVVDSIIEKSIHVGKALPFPRRRPCESPHKRARTDKLSEALISCAGFGGLLWMEYCAFGGSNQKEKGVQL